ALRGLGRQGRAGPLPPADLCRRADAVPLERHRVADRRRRPEPERDAWAATSLDESSRDDRAGRRQPGQAVPRGRHVGAAQLRSNESRYDDSMGSAALALAPGLALGSFLNVVAARVPLKQSLVRPGSACMSCKAPIVWYDNIPLVSYFALRGKCRNCGARIGLVYPAVEIAAALLVAACVLAFGLTFYAAIAAFFCCTLVAIS